MTKKKKAGKINPVLTRAITALVQEVMKPEDPPKAGEEPKAPRYTLTDKMKVLDRALKHEAIRLKVQVEEEGSFFDPQSKGADNGDS